MENQQKRSDTPIQKQGEKKNQKSNGEKFRNICVGIGAIGTMVFPYIQHFFF
ncbi:TPA: hypothetical protein ACTZ52_005434 [Bacillus cereus]